MISFWLILASVILGAVLVLASVLVGGWLVFKSKATQGERFFVQPKGEVFSIADPDNPEFPEGQVPEQNVLKRTEQFMDRLLGGKA